MSRLAFDDSDTEDTAPVAQPLTEITFTTEAAESIVDAPLVIERIPNSFRRTKNYVPNALTQSQTRNGGSSIAELEAAEKARNNVYGLNKPKPSHSINTTQSDGALPAAASAVISRSNVTDEQAAIQALLNSEEITNEQTIERIGGNELFSKIEAHPEMSSLEDYEAVPVESFGLAMLRGMGYNPKQEETKAKLKEKLRRPDFLGLGASERPEDTKSAQELAKKKFEKRKEDRTYVPVVKVNKRTGEVVIDVDNGGQAVASPRSNGINSSLSFHGHSEARINAHNGERSQHYSRSRHDESRRSRHTSEERHRSDRNIPHNSRRHRSRSPRRDSDRDRHSSRRKERRK